MDKKMYFGTISSELAKTIQAETGLNVEKYNLSLGSFEIRKIIKTHGDENKETPRGQRAVTVDDFAHIVDVVLNPKKIELSEDTYMGKPVIVFKGEYNGRMNVTAVISDKRLDLFVQTVFVNVKKGNLSTPIGEQAPINTPEANNGTVSNNSIVNHTQNVNKKSVKSSGNAKYSLSKDELYSLGNGVENVGDVLYNGKKPLSIVDRAKPNKKSSINWFYESEIFSVTENKLFHEKISEINQGSRAFGKNANGEYMIPIENKIVFTDGNYDSPYIREIIEVLTDNATEYEFVKETILGVENGKFDKSEEMQVLKKLFGDWFVVSYKSGVNGVYGWQNGQRKRTTRRTVVRNYLNKQYGRRNDKQSQETPINDIAPVKETSSKDGVFSYGEKSKYSSKTPKEYGNFNIY